LTCAAQFLRYDGRAKDWKAVDAPDRIAEAYLARCGSWKLPLLTGVSSTPFLRADGSICETPGYDPASTLLYKPTGQFPPIPQQPSRREAEEAIAVLKNLIVGFPFVIDTDRAVALSAILTALDRRSIATAPMHAFTAPVAGTGKSLLVDLVSLIVTGQRMPVISQGRNEEELEKRLSAELLSGSAMISIDNCRHDLDSSFLSEALTQPLVKIRVLGLSRIELSPNLGDGKGQAAAA
jgi:hypothetical protein